MPGIIELQIDLIQKYMRDKKAEPMYGLETLK
jgi:hypothetical protein